MPPQRSGWPRLVREQAAERWPRRPTRVEFLDPREEDFSADDLQTGQLLTDPEDELFLLGERCADAYMEADALHYQAMKLLAEFDHRNGWEDTGFSSTAEWLAWRIGIKPGAARERLRTALALEGLPETSEAMRKGALSFTKVRALTRVATPDIETTLLDFARAGSAANLERVVRGWKTLDRKSEVTAEQIRHRKRRFSGFVDEDGMVVVRGRLDPEVGALFMRAVEAASDALYREDSRTQGPGNGADVGADLEETEPGQRRADAVGLIAERALAAGFGNRNGNVIGSRTGNRNRNGNGRGDGNGHGNGDGNGHGDGNGNGNGNGDGIVSGSRAERYQVMLHVDTGTLEEEGEPSQSELEDGTRVSAETSRRIACDVGLVKIAHALDGSVLGAGRRTRTVSPALRRALEARDRGCRFPGCGLRFTDAHHVRHWADGGETSLRKVVLLCRRHHRAVHEGGVTVCMDASQQVVFFTPRGRAFFGAPRAPVEPLAGRTTERRRANTSLERAERQSSGTRREGTTVGTRSEGTTVGRQSEGTTAGGPGAVTVAGAPRWKRDSDIPWDVEARAWEVLDSG